MQKTTESGRKTVLLKGVVTGIGKDFILVSVVKVPGIVHTFRVDEDYVPLHIKELKTNDEVIIELSKREYCDISVDLTDEERKALPNSWHYDPDKKKISVPCCLKKRAIDSLQIRKEVIEHIMKNSWRYGFNAKVVDIAGLQEAYEILERSPRVNGKVIEEVADKEGRIRGVRVLIEVETSMGKRTLKGFLPFNECSWLAINSPMEVLKIGEIIPLKVVSVRPLILSRKKAFCARASIRGVQHIIGKGGRKISQIKEGLDVNIDTKREVDRIILEAPSRRDIDIACERIDLEARRNPYVTLGVWEKE